MSNIANSAVTGLLSIWDGKLSFRQCHDWTPRGLAPTAVITLIGGSILRTGLMTPVLRKLAEPGPAEWKPAIYLEPGALVLRCQTDGSGGWWEPVKEVSAGIAEPMYDIEINQSHCFFANNILIHGFADGSNA